jgi:hypothetical protein
MGTSGSSDFLPSLSEFLNQRMQDSDQDYYVSCAHSAAVGYSLDTEVNELS